MSPASSPTTAELHGLLQGELSCTSFSSLRMDAVCSVAGDRSRCPVRHLTGHSQHCLEEPDMAAARGVSSHPKSCCSWAAREN